MYSKDTFVVIEKLGTNFLPTLFELKRKVDLLSKKIKFLPDKLSKKMFYFQNFIDLVPDIICIKNTQKEGYDKVALVIDDKTYNDAYGKINETFLHTTTYNGFGEESVTALAALNILSRNDFQKKVESLSNLISLKLTITIKSLLKKFKK